jgi:periplasmic copper chaperone A
MLAEQAWAHVEADPASVAAGSTDTITFNLEHGCGDSATVKLEMKLADGVSDAKPAAIDGWTSSQSGGVITWTGGPQPHDEPLDVPVEMTFPNTAGATLLFPLVQTCQQGETRWVDPPNPDGSEAEDPAPLVTLTASTGDGASTTAASATTDAATTTDAVATTHLIDTEVPTDEGSDNTALVIAAVAVGIVAVVGAGAWLLARMNRS